MRLLKITWRSPSDRAVLVEDHQERLTRSYGKNNGYRKRLRPEWVHVKKYAGDLRVTPAAIHTFVEVRQVSSSGNVVKYRIPRESMAARAGSE